MIFIASNSIDQVLIKSLEMINFKSCVRIMKKSFNSEA